MSILAFHGDYGRWADRTAQGELTDAESDDLARAVEDLDSADELPSIYSVATMLKTATIPQSLAGLLPNLGGLCSTAPLRQTGHMKSMLPILALVLLIACSTAQGPLVSKIPDDRREFEIIKVEYSPRQAAARISFSSSFGIFGFDLHPDGRKLKRLTFIVNNQRYCEGLTFQDRTGHTTDLLLLQGVQVFHQGTDLVIEIAPPAVNLLQDANLNDSAWASLTVQTNQFANGTNDTICGFPFGTNVFIRIRAQQ